VKAAEATEITQRYQVALQVKQQYYNILAARESQAAAEAQIDQANQQLRAAGLRLRAGAATDIGFIALCHSAWKCATGASHRSEQFEPGECDSHATRCFTAHGDCNAVRHSRSESRDPRRLRSSSRLSSMRPVVEQAQAELESAKAASRSAKTAYFPTLNMSFSRGGSGLDPAFGLGDKRYAYNQSLNFSLSFPLFNNLNREVSVLRAAVTEDNAEVALRDARFEARQTLVQALGQMNTARQQVDIQAASVAAAVEDLRVQRARYELGASTLLEVLTSQSQLDQARTALIRARYDYRVAKAQLEALIGRDL
jgi:outer membrane protein